MSGTLFPDSSSGRVLEAVVEGNLTPVVNWALAEEIAAVLRRPRFQRYGVTEEDVKAVLELVGPFLPSVEVDVPTRDPRDAPVILAALAGRAEVIVSGDRDLRDHQPLLDWLAGQGIEGLTPVAVLDRIRRPRGGH